MENDNSYVWGIDLGGTTTKLGLFRKNGELVEKWEIPTRTEQDGACILPDIATAIQKKQEEYRISREEILALGIGVPAAVCGEGMVESTTNLGWGCKEVRKELEELTGFSVYVENDANLAALGEQWKGAGRGIQNLMMITLGTGVGGGIIADGRIVRGAKGGAGEIGEFLIEMAETEEKETPSKQLHNLEYYASATGIVRLAKKKIKKYQGQTILNEKNLSAKTVFDAVKAGDRAAIETAETCGQCLGSVISLLYYTLEPEAFLIGGGVSKAGGILLDYIQKGCTMPAVNLMLAELENDAGIYGAAKLALTYSRGEL